MGVRQDTRQQINVSRARLRDCRPLSYVMADNGATLWYTCGLRYGNYGCYVMVGNVGYIMVDISAMLW